MKQMNYLIGLLLLLSGCDTRREILDDESVWVRVNLDWKNADARPNGATVWFFPHRADLKPVALRTHETTDSIRLRMDNYSVLVFNETEKDHGGMHFRGIDRYETFEAYSVPVLQRNTPVVVDGETLVSAPDPLLVDQQDNLDITMNMIHADQRPLLKFAPQPKLYTLQLSVYIHGLDNVLPTASSATLSGLSGGLLLTGGDYSPERVTQQFAFNRLAWDPGSYQKGTLYARFLLFGIDGMTVRQGVANNNKLKLYLKLRDGSTFTLERNVGDLISRGSGSELALELHVGLGTSDKDPIIVVPDVPDKDPGADSGFDADVDDWGDEVIIEIPVQ